MRAKGGELVPGQRVRAGGQAQGGVGGVLSLVQVAGVGGAGELVGGDAGAADERGRVGRGEPRGAAIVRASVTWSVAVSRSPV